MILRVALRSLATRPLRTAVLAAGFGLAVGVMAELLGVGDVILEQAHSPALRGGGDVVLSGAYGSLDSGRFVLENVIGSEPLQHRVAAASPSRRATLYLITPQTSVPVDVRGGIPSLEKAVGDPEVGRVTAWTDAPADAAWSSPDQGAILRVMDRFHPVPGTSSVSSAVSGSSGQPAVSGFSRTSPTPAFNRSSWAEWLYFNGRSADGQLRFYLTFMTGPPDEGGKRHALVRLQLDRAGRSINYSATDIVDDSDVLQRAPDLDVAANRVRLDGLQYRLTLALARETSAGAGVVENSGIRGEIALAARPGRSLPPAAIQGAHGWVSGYVAPVLSGTVHGSLMVDGEPVSFEGLAGYHDHNWGFWEGVRWQWGQVAHGDMSIVFGRLFPPTTVADPDRVPGFLGLLGPEGPIAFSNNVVIEEEGDARGPRALTIRATGEQLDVRLDFSVEESVRTRMPLTQTSNGSTMDFLQLGGVYQVTARAGARDRTHSLSIFTARGSAETFRSQ
jgi:hypothetical protein